MSAQRLFTETRGFETIGYTNPALTAAQCGATSGCNSTGGGNWTIPATVPVGAGAGLVPGTVIDRNFLLANNPGATIQQIDNGLIPRLGRVADIRGRATASTRSSAPNTAQAMSCISTSTASTASRRTS